jgi:twitching motility protein PilT
VKTIGSSREILFEADIISDMSYEEIIEALLRKAINSHASDLHLKANSQPFLRIKGNLISMGGQVMSASVCKNIVLSTMTPEQKEEFKVEKEIDYALKIDNLGRFRVNAYTAQGDVEAVLRIVQEGAKTTEELRLPEILNSLASLKDGLILVAGSTGSGKSSTLAAMIDHINKHKQKRIITIENPVEILHTDNQSLISQREIGNDTNSFATALRSVLRQNPDIILIGEIRDKETADSAIQAAQTGHLVFSTIHAGTAEETISRFAGLYPAEERANLKRSLAYTLKGVLAQRLIVDKNNNKLPVLEIMTSSDRIVQAMLADADGLEGRENITQIIAQSAINNMLTLDQYLTNLVVQNIITPESAIDEAVNPLGLRQLLKQKGYDV